MMLMDLAGFAVAQAVIAQRKLSKEEMASYTARSVNWLFA
jgi:hypothetical protein